jgi:Predicted metal-dependent hydrolase with the TIM-barrel fold
MVHTNAEARTGLAPQALTDAGVDPTRIVIATWATATTSTTCAPSPTPAHARLRPLRHRALQPTHQPHRDLLDLLAEGYADRIHLSHDAATFYDFMTGDPNFADEKPDYLLVWNTVLPALRAAGVDESLMDQMTVENPRRFFGG